MSHTEFDTALVSAALQIAAEQGWRKVSVVDAARAAGLSLVEARERFPSRLVILMRFGRLADQTALADAPAEGPVRDRLFDLLMRRFDAMQPHRAGIRAVLRHAPFDPPLAMLLACATKRSMRWMLQAAGVSTAGVRGEIKVRGLLAVWLWGMRAWERDESEDLSATMAAIDQALGRADQFASWLHAERPRDSGTEPAESAASQPAATQPAAPDAPATEPATPPATPEPVTPQPVTPQPVTPQPATNAYAGNAATAPGQHVAPDTPAAGSPSPTEPKPDQEAPPSATPSA